jgi:hypothetical protein
MSEHAQKEATHGESIRANLSSPQCRFTGYNADGLGKSAICNKTGSFCGRHRPPLLRAQLTESLTYSAPL